MRYLIAVFTATALLFSATPAHASKAFMVRGQWSTISSEAGSYRLEVRCPAGTVPLKASVRFNVRLPKSDRLPRLVDVFPERLRSLSLGHFHRGASRGAFAVFVLDAGSRLRARPVATCRRG